MRFILLVTGDNSGVVTFSEAAAARWEGMGRIVKVLDGDLTEEKKIEVFEADKTIGEWLDRVEANR